MIAITVLLATARILGMAMPVQSQVADTTKDSQPPKPTTMATITPDLSHIRAATMDMDRLVITLRDSPADQAPEQLVVEDVSQIKGGIRHIANSLTIKNSSNEAAQTILSTLETAGDIYLSNNPQLAALDLPRLTKVGNDFELFECDNLVSLSLPLLQQTGGDIYIYDIPKLQTLSCPSLTHVGDDIYIGKYEYEHGTHSLSKLDLSALSKVSGYAEFEDVGQLSHLDLPVLESVGDYFDVDENTHLVSVSVPKLASVGGEVEIDENRVLEAMHFPSLKYVGDDFDFHKNLQLSNIDAPALLVVDGDLKVSENLGLKMYSLPVACNVSGDATSVYETATTQNTEVVICSDNIEPQPCSEDTVAAHQKRLLADLHNVMKHTTASIKSMITQMESIQVGTEDLEEQLSILEAARNAPVCL